MSTQQRYESKDYRDQPDDFDDKHYTVAGYSTGIAWFVRGYVPAGWDDDDRIYYGWLDDQVHAIMVGDDRVFTVDVDDLTEIDELAFCHECGQVGCGHDGLDRS